MAPRIQFRRGTAAEWTAANPVLAAGEFGYEADTEQFKIGDGATAWSALTYFSAVPVDTVRSRYYDSGASSWPARGAVPPTSTVMWISYTSGVIDPPEFEENIDILMVPT